MAEQGFRCTIVRLGVLHALQAHHERMRGADAAAKAPPPCRFATLQVEYDSYNYLRA